LEIDAMSDEALSKIALVVDLDGTLIATDLLHEGTLALAKQHPMDLLKVPGWLGRGKAELKSRISSCVEIDPAMLPYRDEVLEMIRQARTEGRVVLLATASPRSWAEPIAQHLGLFDAVLATGKDDNLSGDEKLKAIREHLSDGPFEYVGDHFKDLPIWQAAERAHCVNPSSALRRKVESLGKPGRVVESGRNLGWTILRALRPQQWSKNVLLVVPAVLAHDLRSWPQLLLAFFAFSLCASSVYIFNDLMDIDADRRHPQKCRRPFASGELPVSLGLVLTMGLLIGALLISVTLLPTIFLRWLALYFAATLAYSLWLKRKLVVDVVTLAGLYTMRLMAGAAVAGTEVSAWLLSFGMFFFFGLAFAKRFTEVLPLMNVPDRWLPGRGYLGADLDIIRVVGPVSGYLAVLVLALYIDSEKVRSLYQRPDYLWLVCPALLYWITRLWFFAQRRALHDDPVVFALTDPESWVVAIWSLAILYLATIG
jgi:4-hydroxybenzoate polyprenyltransferase/phosphoserine phosphatase